MNWIVLSIVLLLSFGANLFIGSVDIPVSEVWNILCGGGNPDSPLNYIVLQSRLPAALTAILGGSALSLAGLMMQTAFRNPLAGPSIMGINSGASLGVAVIVLLTGGIITTGSVFIQGEIAIIIGALAGSFLILGLLILLSSILHNELMLLIAGILIGYLASSLITILNFSASADSIQSYVMWGMGSFSSVTMPRLSVFAIITITGIFLAFLLIKPLDALLLGDNYAVNLGINIKRVRQLLLVSTGILAAGVTAYCGPISFIGLAVPHISRFILATDSHRRLFPMTLLVGSTTALLCNILSILPASNIFGIGGKMLPLNAITPLFAVPVILYVILKRSR